MNIANEYHKWLATTSVTAAKDPTLERELFMAFDAGYRAGQLDYIPQPVPELSDPRDVIIARLSIDLERKNAMIQELREATHAAKESMHEAIGKFDKLRFGYF